MKYFSPAYFKFFDTLSKNNNKEWFDENRETYENEIKKPFRKLMEDLTEKMSKDLPELNRDVSKSVFRINRDIRFAKDKSPYKVHMAGVLSRKGTRDEDYPGFYIHIGADDVAVGGGKYSVSKEQLEKIRQEIFYNNADFKKILNAKEFKEKYKTLEGEKNKVLSPNYKEFLKEQPLIANKQFWYWASVGRKEALNDNFDKVLLSYLKAGLKMNKFLLEAVSN